MEYDIERSGKIIRELRRKNGLTQNELAKKVGLSYRTIADIERGSHGTTVDNLLKLATLFDTSLEYIIAGYEKCVYGNQLVENLSDDKKQKIIEVINILSVVLD